MSSSEKLGVTVCFILKESEEIILKFILVMRRNWVVFSCPTNDTRGYPAKNLKGSKSGIYKSEQRVNKK